MATLSLEKVSYVYGARTPFEIKALDDVSLTVRQGSVTGIIGHTGSGKSTLVQLLNGLEKPTSGKVMLDGEGLCAFKALGLRDFARIDFKENHHGEPILLEANTLPGLTKTSLLPLAAQTAGIPFPALCERMAALAAKRKRDL